MLQASSFGRSLGGNEVCLVRFDNAYTRLRRMIEPLHGSCLLTRDMLEAMFMLFESRNAKLLAGMRASDLVAHTCPTGQGYLPIWPGWLNTETFGLCFVFIH
jgi:hypothetical protein